MIVQYVPNIHAKLFGREFIMLKLLKKVTISAVLVVATSTIYPALGVAADSYQKDKLSGAEQHPLSFKLIKIVKSVRLMLIFSSIMLKNQLQNKRQN